MTLIDKWVRESVNQLFDYAMGYITDAGIIPTPKFHLVDIWGRSAIISCDFWDYEDENKSYARLGATLDEFATSFAAIACLLIFVGEMDGVEIIGILTYKDSCPKLHYKPLIWAAGIVDFGPLYVLPWDKIKNLNF